MPLLLQSDTPPVHQSVCVCTRPALLYTQTRHQYIGQCVSVPVLPCYTHRHAISTPVSVCLYPSCLAIHTGTPSVHRPSLHRHAISTPVSVCPSVLPYYTHRHAISTPVSVCLYPSCLAIHTDMPSVHRSVCTPVSVCLYPSFPTIHTDTPSVHRSVRVRPSCPAPVDA